jgi:flagellar biosynthetic protein FliR
MTLASVLLPFATSFGLVVARLAGFVTASPFPGENVSRTARVGLVAVLAFFVTSSRAVAPVPFDAHVIATASIELALGALIGLVFRFLFLAADVIGVALSQSTGLGVPSLLDPATGSLDATPSRIVSLTAMLVALGAGAHRVVLADVLESFRAIPPGADVRLANGVLPIVHVATNAFTVGVRISMPLVAVALLVQVALALVARVAPTLQVFNAGMSVMVGTGLLAFLADRGNVLRALQAHFDSLHGSLIRVLEAVGSGT